ncbi:YhgE/Pip domain-containing protein [Acidipropionibacterium timonense]|uniref:YhgE/Pip domain-containing protein n=1 Tax=Acidipropionibacterium timonense TaxID=2161818 RepID=UPI0010306A8A|nr:YhgE/Pip domain-containing protein [Acidipropionibacterium timonense]
MTSTDTFDWHEVSAQTARDGVDDDTYAAEVLIPEGFSAPLAGSGSDLRAARIRVVYNDANGYTTRTVVSTVVTRIHDAVSQSLGSQLADKLFLGYTSIHDQLSGASTGARTLADGAGSLDSGVLKLSTASAQLASGTATLAGGVHEAATGSTALADGASTLSGKLEQARSGARQVSAGATRLSQGLPAAVSGATTLAQGASALADGATTAASSSSTLADSQQTAATSASTLASTLSQASTGATQLAAALAAGPSSQQQAAIAQFTATLSAPQQQAFATLLGSLQANQRTAATAAGLTRASTGASTLAAGQQRIATGQTQLTAGLSTLASKEKTWSTGAATLHSSLVTAAGGASSLATGASSLSSGVDRLATGASTLAQSSRTLSDGLGRLDTGSATLASGSSQLATGAASARSGSSKVASGASSMSSGNAKAATAVPSYSSARASANAKVVAQPVEESQSWLHRASGNGEGFAPYFAGVSLYVGGIILWILLRPLNRRNLLTPVSARRIVVREYVPACALGVMGSIALVSMLVWGMGLHPGHLVAMFGVAALASLCFLALQQMLVIWFRTPGRLLAIILLIVQLASANGTYPVATSPAFYRAVSPWLPMTHVVTGLRQAITGDLGVPFWTAVLFLALGCLACLVVSMIGAARSRTWTLSSLHPALKVAV